MAFVDPQTIHNPASGTSPPATWGDQVRDNDIYLYNRGPYICTSATRPGSPSAGYQIFETDTLKSLVYDGSNWWTIGIAGNAATTYTNVLMVNQAGAVAHTANVSEYRIISGVCEWWFNLSITASGSAGNAVTLVLPVTASAASRTVGEGTINDNSASTFDSGVWELVTTTTIALASSRSTTNYWGSTPSLGIANADTIRGHVRYRVASAA